MRRNGFTLVEMVMIIVIMGIMMMMMFPKMQGWSARADAQGARTSVTALLARARAAAVSSNRQVTVTFASARGLATASPRLSGAGTVDTIGSPLSLDLQYGVTMTPDNWSVTYDPRGIGTNIDTWTVTATKSGHSAALTVAPYGRINR